MTFTSTASSGGGLPDFGVFQNQKVYTVYLDMRASDDDPAPSWTLQYAVTAQRRPWTLQCAVLQPPADPAIGAPSKSAMTAPLPYRELCPEFSHGRRHFPPGLYKYYPPERFHVLTDCFSQREVSMINATCGPKSH